MILIVIPSSFTPAFASSVTYTKGSDGSAAHQYKNPCKVTVQADPGLVVWKTLYLEPRSYSFPVTARAAPGWKIVSARYRNNSDQDVVSQPPSAAAASTWPFTVPKNCTLNGDPWVVTVRFATLRQTPGGSPDYQEDITIATTVVSSLATLDVDANGLRDQWEIQFFGHTGNDPAADPDGDGWTNLQECQQGSDPLRFNAENQSLSLPEDSTLAISLTPHAVPSGLACQILTPPAHGSLSGSAPNLIYQPYAHYNGSDSFTFRAARGSQTSTAAISLTVTPVNDAPLVDAGANQTLILSGTPATASASLHATVTDIDSTTFTYAWSVTDGPGAVNFTAPTAASTAAQFTKPGLYILRATVSDGDATRSDSLLVLVNSAASALTVTLANPGSTFPSPAQIALTATVSGGTATRVNFYEGPRQIGSAAAAPFTKTWLKSRPGTYRVTATATDAAGLTVVSAPVLLTVRGLLIGGGGGDVPSINGPGNEGNSHSGGDGGAGQGGSGTSGPTGGGGTTGTGGTGGGGTGGGDLDPDSDDDGDGVLNGTDLYPLDFRRSEDVSPIHYAVIDLGQIDNILPSDKEIDQIALGQDGRMAFSWWADNTTYKVAKWKDGQIVEGSPKTASLVYGAFSADGDIASVVIDDNGYSFEGKPSEDVEAVDRWVFASSSIAKAYSDYAIGDHWYDTGSFSDDGTYYTTVIASRKSGEHLVDADFHVGVLSLPAGSSQPQIQILNVNSSGYAWYHGFQTPPVELAFAQNGTIGAFVYGPEGLNDDWTAGQWLRGNYIFDSSGFTKINGDAADPGPESGTYLLDSELKSHSAGLGLISVINDDKELILADSPAGKFVSYTGATSHGELRTLLPEKYSKQTRYGSDDKPDAETPDAKMEAINNDGTLLFAMQNLEGEGQGQWVKRHFLAPKLPSAGAYQHALHVAEFPDNYEVEPIAGPQGFTDSGLLAAKIKKTKNDDGSPITNEQKWRPGFQMPCELTVDANRDGTIKPATDDTGTNENEPQPDVTTKERPFRFWCNDDFDSQDADYPDASSKNSQDLKINCKRDLEDYTRLHINIGSLQDAIANGTIQVGLEWRNTTGNPSIKVAKAVEPDGGQEYITGGAQQGNENWANSQILLPDATLYTIDSTPGFKFPASFWQSNSYGLTTFSADHPNRYLLFDGITEGKGELVLTFWKGTTKIGEGGGCWLDLQNIKKMYYRGKAQPENIAAPNGSTSGPFTGPMSWVPDNNGQPFPTEKPKGENDQAVIFVHGWSMSYNYYINFTETMFKRLWHQGFKGRLCALRWDPLIVATVGDIAVSNGEYNRSEHRAWLYGESLKQFAQSIKDKGFKVSLIGHSMGNVVCGSALQKGLQVQNYLLMEAAIPAGCFDASSGVNSFGRFVTAEQNDPTPDYHQASNGDLTKGYRGFLSSIYGNVAAKVVDYHNKDDYALATGFKYGFEANWEKNQIDYKPDGNAATDWTYRYFPEKTLAERADHVKHGVIVQTRFVTDSYEMKSFVARPRSKAAGAVEGSDNPTPSGMIDVNLRTIYHFDTRDSDHSGQFNRRIQEVDDLYLDILNVVQPPPP